MVGKEALAIAGFLWVIRACVDITVKNPLKLFPLAMGLFLSVMIRPHYAIAYAYLFLLSLVFSKAKFDVFKSTKHNVVCLLVCVFIGSLVFSALCERYSTYLLNLMHAIKFKFFLYQGGRANRLDIVWENFSDVIANLWWGIPMSIVGPTWHETLARPFILPAFLEGVFALGLFVFIFFKMIKCAMDNPNYNAIIILGFVPAILFGLLINYPFGLFNPGSAIRYKQSLAPLFYFYPILLMSEIKMKSLLRHH